MAIVSGKTVRDALRNSPLLDRAGGPASMFSPGIFWSGLIVNLWGWEVLDAHLALDILRTHPVAVIGEGLLESWSSPG